MDDIALEIDPIRGELAKKIHAQVQVMSPGIEITVMEIFRLLERPPESSLGDFALPCFRFAKILRKGPPQIAELLKKQIEQSGLDPWISEIKVVQAFINIFINKTKLLNTLVPKVLNNEFFIPTKTREHNGKTHVMIEFSQPNTHKEFHIGHARNVCLGDSLCRIYRYLGYDLTAANYIGDEGTHVAKCLWQVLQKGGGPQADEPNKAFWYGQRYVEASQILAAAEPEQKKIYEKKISQILAELESKKGSTYELWQKSRLECLADFKRTYKWLDVNFDHYFFESEVSEEAQAIVDEYMAKGLFKISDGAVGIDMNSYDLGFFMARKSDGTTPYITKDLALARRKFEDFKIDHSIYVVGSEQNFHFQQLFKALELMGFKQAKDCYHLSYAHVRLPEGKMSSRTGNSLPFAFLRQNLLSELEPYLEKYKDQWSPEELEQAANHLAVGAIKYGMLCSDPIKDITFDLRSWTSFEGNTGPYLMYSYARTRSIVAKALEQGFSKSEAHLEHIKQPHALELLRFIYDFNDVVKQSCEHHKPSILANHLYNMSKSFNRFYVEVPILKASSNEERSALLSLVESFALTLKKGLNLLGITPPERM